MEHLSEYYQYSATFSLLREILDCKSSNNFSALFYNIFDSYSIFVSIPALAGCTAGILGLTGLLGFVFYLIALLGFYLLLNVKTGKNSEKYFISRTSLLTNGFLGGLCTYTLFWTFLYGMIHVYWSAKEISLGL